MADLFNSGIRPAIDNWLLEESKKVRNYGDYWSASSAGYCMRKNIFERLGVPHVTEDARKQRVFTSGHLFHEWIQGITKEAGLSIARELELQDEDLMVRGHIDDLVLVGGEVYYDSFAEDQGAMVAIDVKQPHLILYDYKTQNSRAFSYQADKGRSMSHYHRMQLGTYMYMLRNDPVGGMVETDTQNLDYADLIKDLTEARICYISKDDLRMSETQLLWTPDLEKEVVGYWRTLNGYWKKKTLPKCTCADYEGGFLAKEKYNPFFYNGESCSTAWYQKCKEEGLLKEDKK